MASTKSGDTKRKASAKPAKDGWTRGRRERLSAIRIPHPMDPKKFYLDVDAAWAALGETGTPPTELTHASEQQRWARARMEIGSGTTLRTGPNCSRDFWNPLVALWVGRRGWEFVFDMTLHNPPPLMQEVMTLNRGSWTAVRRYLNRASDEEYAHARASVAPVFERLRSTDDWDERRVRDYIAFAFIREGWADALLRDYVAAPTSLNGPLVTVLVATSQNTQLALDAMSKYTDGTKVHMDYQTYIFDIVESYGREAVQILEQIVPHHATDKRLWQEAMDVALSL